MILTFVFIVIYGTFWASIMISEVFRIYKMKHCFKFGDYLWIKNTYYNNYPLSLQFIQINIPIRPSNCPSITKIFSKRLLQSDSRSCISGFLHFRDEYLLNLFVKPPSSNLLLWYSQKHKTMNKFWQVRNSRVSLLKKVYYISLHISNFCINIKYPI